MFDKALISPKLAFVAAEPLVLLLGPFSRTQKGQKQPLPDAHGRQMKDLEVFYLMPRSSQDLLTVWAKAYGCGPVRKAIIQ